MFLFILHCVPPPMEAKLLEGKTTGKIGFAFVLAVLAVGVKYWQNRDLSNLQRQRSYLLSTEMNPKILEFTFGFDIWIVESYGESQIRLRNGVWQNTVPKLCY